MRKQLRSKDTVVIYPTGVFRTRNILVYAKHGKDQG